jgi:hypothetical protein
MSLTESMNRRASLRPDASGELRLNSRGEILMVHRHKLLDRVARMVVDLRPARRTVDYGDRVGLRAILDDGRGLWLGEACNVMASALAISHKVCVVRVDGEMLVGLVVPLTSTLEHPGDAPGGVEPATVEIVARHFDGAATCVALTGQPGNPDPEAPLTGLVRRLSRAQMQVAG